MGILDTLHERLVRERRVALLSRELAAQLPENARVLDVGCGDGQIAARIGALRPDLEIHGIDVLVRGDVQIPVTPFDGSRIPHPDASFDAITMVDMLHHTDDPMVLLREAARVATGAVVLKDHTLAGFLAEPTLRFMDRVGNERHGVVLPYNYWTEAQWRSAFDSLSLRVAHWDPSLGLFPWPANWLFDRSLHFIARLAPPDAA